ncbi:hypothetical protein [Rhizobium leguminosarum]|uniref:hypothetical protein n=1 Tax=Rhizobium leguminosarum TaxID=384 RepID=UPI001C96B1CF|nr:hypothetical protein [Rhizobium leguminosarum]MBY5529697.1 hypothetical protein [Rhizobium leguminosarum]
MAFEKIPARIQVHNLVKSSVGDVPGVARELGRALVKLVITDETDIEGKHILVAATPEDIDLIAGGFIDLLSERKAKVTISCFWNIERQTANGDWFVDLAAQYNDLHPQKPDYAFAVTSSIEKPAGVAANLDRLREFTPKSWAIVVPATSIDARKRLEDELQTRDINGSVIQAAFGLEKSDALTAQITARIIEYLEAEHGQGVNFFVPALIRSRPPMPRPQPPAYSPI